jgi:RND family efflux transporter MFP subunit
MLRNGSLFLLGMLVCLAATPLHAADLTARGLVKAQSRAVLASELGAVVTQTPKRVGDSFKKGDTLVSFDCRLFKSQKDKVSAEVKAAKARLANAQDLEKMRSIGKLDVTIAKADYDKTRAELKIADLNVSRCKVTAPYNGKVVNLLVNRFESIDIRHSLIEIVSASHLEVDIIAPAGWLSRIATGELKTMRIDELDTSVQIEILGISAAIDPVSQTVLIRAKVLDQLPGLLPGMSGAVGL